MSEKPSLFKPAEMEQAFVKAGAMGFMGSGKTLTIAMIILAAVLHARKLELPYARKPVYFVDTETGSDFIKPLFDHFGVELHVARTRAFYDLFPAFREAEEKASGIIVDSISHHWKEFMESYKARTKRRFIQFEDWDFLKTEWGGFTTLYTASQVHAGICGRAGYEYDYFEREDGKKELEKTGIKMKAEGEFGFEPSLLLLMEREVDLTTNLVRRTAHVLKDRFMLIDGKSFGFPNPPDGAAAAKRYEYVQKQVAQAFGPHLEALAWGKAHAAVDGSRSSASHIPEGGKPQYKIDGEQRAIIVEKIGNLFTQHGHTSQSKDGKMFIIERMQKYFNTSSWKELESMPLKAVRDGYNKLHIELNGAPAFDDKSAQA